MLLLTGSASAVMDSLKENPAVGTDWLLPGTWPLEVSVA